MIFSSNAQDSDKNLLEVAESTKNIETFRKLLKAAGVGPTITGTKEYTIFAPSDEAFTFLGERKLKALLASKDTAALKALVELHIVPGKLTSSKMKDGKIEALSGDKIKLYADEEEIDYGSGVVQGEAINASNGLIYVIDAVVKVYSDED